MNKIIFFFQLGQDLDILLPSVIHFSSRGHKVKAVIKNNLMKHSPRMNCLRDLSIEVEELPTRYSFFKTFKLLKDFDYIFTASESTASPHKEAYKFVRFANFLGKQTITLQHGYENIGLTYSDNEYPISKIKFASKTILTWSNELHPLISDTTRKKCIAAGLPKSLEAKESNPIQYSDYIAIFENLHWRRYSDLYRTTFIELLIKIAESMPDRIFLVKPHHAGKWLTTRFKGTIPNLTNLKILNPDSAEWEPYTAPTVITNALKVISTPSSVCIDAALAGKPVAILDFDKDVQGYSFANHCMSIEDVINFIKSNNVKDNNETGLLSHSNYLKTLENLVR